MLHVFLLPSTLLISLLVSNHSDVVRVSLDLHAALVTFLIKFAAASMNQYVTIPEKKERRFLMLCEACMVCWTAKGFSMMCVV